MAASPKHQGLWGSRSESLDQLFQSALARYGEHLLFALILFTAQADSRSLWSGGGMALFAWLALTWVDAYPEQAGIVRGPYRFVRHPKRLFIWLVWIGMALAARSFPAVLCSLILLPLVHGRDLHSSAKGQLISDLAARRYMRYVPALVPTLFPYPASPQIWAPSWKRALLRIEGRRRLLLGYLLFASASVALMPFVPSWAAAVAWIFLATVFDFYRRRSHSRVV